MAYIITDNAITIHTDKPYTFSRSNMSAEQFTDAVDLLVQGEEEKAVEVLSPVHTLERFFSSSGDTVIENGAVWVNGRQVDDYTTRKAIEFARENLPVEPILNFIERIQANPSYRAVQEAYAFIENGNLPLRSDGRFVAYKKVRRVDAADADMTRTTRLVDIHSGKFDNNPGSVVAIRRNEVDEDPDRPCSYGLHVCTYQYLPAFGGGAWDTVVSVAVDPADVVAVPRDYRNAKMRVCRYEVLEELEDYTEGTDYWGGALLVGDPMIDEDEEFDEEFFV